jgi:LysM repeat protein
MRRKSLTLLLVGLMILSAFLAGCRKSAAPPVEELAPEDGASAVMQELEPTAEEMQPEEATPAEAEETEMEPTETEAAAPEPTETVLEPVATEESEPESEPPPTPVVTETSVIEEAPEVSSDGSTYVVRPGDNLFRIALNHGVTVQALSQANNITNPALINVGQELTIPTGDGTATPPTTPPTDQTCSTVYVVQPGDNLFRIALRHNQSQMYLAQINGITNPSLVYVGQQICIP